MLITKVMQNIGNELKAIAAELDLIYIRAIDVNDLNQRLQNINIDKPVLVYSGLAPVEFDDDLTAYEIAKIETTIYVLDIHKTADPTAEQIDELLAPLYILTNYVYDLLTRSALVAPAADVQRDSLQSSETVELTDENLGGWELVLTIPIARDLYKCD